MRAFLASALVALAVITAGCGGGGSSTGTGTTSSNSEASKPARQVLTDAANAVDSASSLHMAGWQQAGEKDTIDVSVVPGKGATGSMSVNGARADLVLVDGKGYLRGGYDFLRQQLGAYRAGVARLAAGKWVEFPTNNVDFEPIVLFANPKLIFHGLKSTHGTLTNNGATTYNGQSVVAIHSPAAKWTLYIAASGKPYPVAVTQTGTASMTFDGWNNSVTLKAPSGAVDFSHLSGG